MFSCINVGTAEFIIKKSRFIAIARLIQDRSQVKREIETLRREYPDATHICYGFIADETGNDFGYDDDGEPSGTAGKPIYSAIAASGARRSLIAVVRYFGGVKLGAGGLTRAYRQCAADLIAQVGTGCVEKLTEYSVECDGETYKKISAILRNTDCKCEQIMYNDKVRFTLVCTAESDAAKLLKPLGITPVKCGDRYEYL